MTQVVSTSVRSSQPQAVPLQITEQQREALAAVISSPQSIVSITGPAGSGKTTIIKELASHYDDVAVVAFTNAAAKVLRRKGLPATTIHAKFYVPEERMDSKGKRYTAFVPCDEYAGKLPPGKIEHADVIIVDEASMLAYRNLRDLQRMCDKLILVGDGDQLPPVRDTAYPKGFFNTMKHTAVLTEVHRQGAGNPVLAMATKLRERKVKALDASVFAQFQMPTGSTFEGMAKALDVQEKTWKAITFTNADRQKINRRVRKMNNVSQHLVPQPGELMVCGNNFSDFIVNGTFLEVVSAQFPHGEPDKTWRTATISVRVVDGGPEILTIKMHLASYLAGFLEHKAVAIAIKKAEADEECLAASAHLDFGYAVTCHKAQGSEYDHVFVVDGRNSIYWVTETEAKETGNPEAMRGPEAARRWAYTAMTRTRGGLTVISGTDQ